MSDYWYNEDYEYEPEPVLCLPEESAELKLKLSINAGQIELAVQEQINEILQDRIKRMIKDKISIAMKNLLNDTYWGQKNIEKMLYKAVQERLNDKYPEVVENKVNEFSEAIKNLKYSEGRNDKHFLSIKEKAAKKVELYIETELKDSVSKSREYIEQFAKNYFANNLFRAMNMMDKMLPQTENMNDSNKNQK